MRRLKLGLLTVALGILLLFAAAAPAYAYNSYLYWTYNAWWGTWGNSTDAANSVHPSDMDTYYRLGSSLSSEWISAVRAAAATWDATGYYDFSELAMGQNQYDHTVGMNADIAPKVGINYATATVTGSDVLLTNWYIRFNPNKPWSNNGSGIDRQACATHEMGHCVYLVDLSQYDPNWDLYTEPTMYAYISSGTIRWRTLSGSVASQSGDIYGVYKLWQLYN